jgi:hypothetical protein
MYMMDRGCNNHRGCGHHHNYNCYEERRVICNDYCDRDYGCYDRCYDRGFDYCDYGFHNFC